jgi:hypothetical protein
MDHELAKAARELADAWSLAMDARNVVEHQRRMDAATQAVYAALKKYPATESARP